MPQKMTARYSRMRGHTSAGTRRNTRIPSRHQKAAAFKSTVITAIMTKEAKMASFNPFSSFWPKRMENRAPLPMHSPSRMEVRKVIRV